MGYLNAIVPVPSGLPFLGRLLLNLLCAVPLVCTVCACGIVVAGTIDGKISAEYGIPSQPEGMFSALT